MSEAFVKVDLHGLRKEEAVKVIDKAIASASAQTYQIHLIHGYHRGENLKRMILEEYSFDPRIRRIVPGDNQGITVLVMKELY